MQAVIMAGGKGTRLGALTLVAPKPMLPINGKPILQYQIENLRNNGITNIIIVVGYLGERIKEFFKDGSIFGVNIDYITENQPLGTAGAFYFLKDRIRENFVLLYGDVMLSVDFSRFADFHRRKNAIVSLFAHPNSHPFDSDVIEVDDDGRVFFCLPKNIPRGDCHNLVNAGVYMCKSEVLMYAERPEKLDFEKDLLFSKLLPYGVYAYRSPEYVKDAGTPERLIKVEKNERSGIITKRNLKRKQKCVFLDRDGTINVHKGFISEPDDIELEDGVIEALCRLNNSEYLCILVTNQPVVARGLCTIKELNDIHKRLETMLGLQGVYFDDMLYCLHHPDRGFEGERLEYKIDCSCRKPKTGMIDDCVDTYNIERIDSFMVGDTSVDVQTGVNAKLRTILLKTGEAGMDKKFDIKPDRICRNLLEAVDFILGGDF